MRTSLILVMTAASIALVAACSNDAQSEAAPAVTAGDGDGGAVPDEDVPETVEDATGEPASKPPAKRQIINEMCPVMPEEAVDPDYVFEFQGQLVGLCCEDCIPVWEDMSDAEKKEALDDLK